MRKQFKNISLLVFLLSLFITGGSHAAPKDIQSIIDTAKLGHLTEDMHKKYWDWAYSLGNKKGRDKQAVETLINWYPEVNRLQLDFNREFIKSLKLTLKNKKTTYSGGYENSYQKMKAGTFDFPFKKGTKEYADAYSNAILSFKQSKDGVDKMFKHAVSGEVFTYPFNKDVQFKIDLQYVLALEQSIEKGWGNLRRLFNPTWSN